jgi:CheY-like chemotaxis protein
MAERTRALERDLDHLVDTAGRIARRAAALAARTRAADTNPDELRGLCSDQARRSVLGLEATRLIKATEATRDSRVIACTANDSMPSPLEGWFVAVLSKPSPPDRVLAAVQSAVSL